MAKAAWYISCAVLALFLHSGCDISGNKGHPAPDSQPPHAPNGDAEILHATADTLSSAIPIRTYDMPGRRGTMLAELVDCTQLAALLPDSLPNMKRDEKIAEHAVNDSVLVSMASGTYADPAGNSIEIKITDSGDLKIFASSFYPWLDREVQSETKTSYERMVSFDGYRGFERYYLSEQSGEMYIMVGGHFMVEVTGYGVLPEELRKAVSRVDLHKLEALQAQD